MNDVDWIGLAQDRDKRGSFVDAGMKLRAILNAEKFFSVCTTGGLSISGSAAELRVVCTGSTYESIRNRKSSSRHSRDVRPQWQSRGPVEHTRCAHRS
jgi:hypothetical protein